MTNRAVIYKAPYTMSVEDIGYPKMESKGKPIEHGVILRVLVTNICGSDLHMYRGRTDLFPGTAVGHEITGEIIEKGRDVEFLEVGDIVSVPFNVACGRCRNCKTVNTHLCLKTNDLKPGGGYGYAEMGPWQGGQAEYVMIPYADFNLLKLPDREMAMEKIEDFSMLTDVFPTGFHGAVTAGVGPGSTVYIAGAGPVGLCAAVSSYILGASCVIIGDINQERLDHAHRTLGCEVINIRDNLVIQDQIAEILGVPEVDCGIDAIGYEAHGHGPQGKPGASADALDTLARVTRYGGQLGIVGVYLPMDPKGSSLDAKMGRPKFEFGRMWDKAQTISTGQVPVMRYHRQLMTLMMFNRVSLKNVLNSQVISLEDAPNAYQEFDAGAAKKFIIDPHHVLSHTASGPTSNNRQEEFMSVS